MGVKNGQMVARAGVTRACAYCGAPFGATAAAVARGHGLYCSRAHAAAARRRRVDAACDVCGKEISLRARRIAPSGRRLCSRDCANAARRTVGRPRPCAICGKSFTPLRGSQATCSRACAAERRQVQNLERNGRPCPICGKRFVPSPANVRRGYGRYCSQACYGISKRSRVELTCARCGKPFSAELGRARTRRYCGAECWHPRGSSPQEQRCQRCGEVFRAHLSAGRKFCSRTCADEAQRAGRPQIACAICRTEFAVPPRLARRQRYCSPACAAKGRGATARARRPRLPCAHCRAPIDVQPYVARRRKYCSRACANEAKRAGQVRIECATCRRSLMVPPSQARQRYCSLSCAGSRALPPQTHRCPACGRFFSAPAWRKPRFCGRACANHGRELRRDEGRAARDALVLALHHRGLNAKQILKALEAERGTEWGCYSPATIRSVVHRNRARPGAPTTLA